MDILRAGERGEEDEGGGAQFSKRIDLFIRYRPRARAIFNVRLIWILLINFVSVSE